MNTIDMQNSDEFSDEGFWAKIREYAKKIGSETVHKAICLWLVIKEGNAPLWAKSTAVGALGYLISPLDVVPDLTPFVGYSDDIAVIAAAFTLLAVYITEEIRIKAKRMMPQWLRY